MGIAEILAIVGIIEKAAVGISMIVRTLELVFGKGTGATKKEIATQAAKGLITTMVQVSGGGQKEFWQKLDAVEADKFAGSAVELAVQGMKAMQDYKKVEIPTENERNN